MYRFAKASLLPLGCVLLSTGSLAQDLDRKVSFSMPASRASVLLAALGPQVGLNLSTSGQTDGEVLLVKVKDVPVKELLAKIAEAADGEWRQEQNGMRLVRSSDSWKRIEREELKGRSAEIAGALGTYNERIAKLPPFNEAEAQRLAKAQQDTMSQLMKKAETGGPISIKSGAGGQPEATPGGRAMVSILNSIGPDDLAKVTANRRLVWSTSPNRLQLPLSGKATTILRQFIREQQMYSNAARSAQPADDTRQVKIMGIGGGESGPGNPNLGIGKAIVTAERFGAGLRCQMVVADPNGQTIGTANFTLITPQVATSEASENRDKLTASPLTREMASLIKTSFPAIATGGMVRKIGFASNGSNVITFQPGGDQAPLPTSAELRARLLQPEKFDPLSLGPTEAFVGTADRLGQNLVASLPDTSLWPLTVALAEGLTPENLLTITAARAKIKVAQTGGWIVARPMQGFSARKERIDRPSMGRLLRSLTDQGYARIADLAAFANVNPQGVAANDPTALAMRLVNAPTLNEALGYLSQPNVLRLYASLNSNFASSGGTVPLGALTPAQAEILAAEVYNSPAGPQALGNDSPLRFGLGSLATERTEMLPNGLPRDGSFTLRIDGQPAALGVDPSGATTLVTPEVLAMRMLQSERTDLAVFGPVSKLEHFWPAAQTNITMTFQFSPQIGLQRQLADTVINRQAPKVAFSGLPAEMRQRTEQTLDRLRNSFKGIPAGGMRLGGGRTIPPVP